MLGATPAGGRRFGRWRNRPAVAAHRSWPYTATSIFNKVFTYGIGVTWRTYFSHLGRTAGNNDGWCGQGGTAQARRRWWRASGLLRLNWGHQHGHRSSVILLGWSIQQERRHTGVAVSFTRQLGFWLSGHIRRYRVRLPMLRRSSPVVRLAVAPAGWAA
jgi:hypothetical protein